MNLVENASLKLSFLVCIRGNHLKVANLPFTSALTVLYPITLGRCSVQGHNLSKT